MEPVFKPYEQNQPDLIPRSWSELIPENHIVKLVNRIIDGFPLEKLYNNYPGGGASAYHPIMLIKVILFAYVCKIYTSRRIAKAVRENIHFIWLAGGNQPDFRTINRFRGSKLKDLIDTLFYELLKVLMKEGKVSFEKYFLDGTKIESKANRYTFVWGRATAKFEARLDSQVKQLCAEIEQLEEAEKKEYGDEDLEEMKKTEPLTAEEIKAIGQRIRKVLEQKALEEPLAKDLKKN
jgi:transposase